MDKQPAELKANEKKIKLKEKKWVKWVCLAAAAAVVVVCFLVLRGGSGGGGDVTYTLADVERGTISKTVTASGALSAPDTYEFENPVDMTVTGYLASVGDSVRAGDVLAAADPHSLDAGINSLSAEISSLDSTIYSLYSNRSSTATITAPQAGRVKRILAAKGEDVKSIIANNGALMQLSADGKMKVETPLSEPHGLFDSLTVVVGGKKYAGTVGRIDGDIYTITFTDNGPAADADAAVLGSAGEQIGGGVCQINAPISITLSNTSANGGAAGGTVSSIYVSLGTKVYKGTSLMYLKDVPLSDEYTAAIARREELAQKLTTALGIQATGLVTSPVDGIIESLGQGGVFAKFYQGGATKLDVTVDELDVASMSVGQKAAVTLDAVRGVFSGTVSAISSVGSNNSGVTSYDVSIVLEPNEAFLIGMNASAIVTIEERDDVLIIPLAAVQYSRGEQYVWKYSGSLPSGNDDAAEPGVRTPVVTGLSDAGRVEIIDGLSEGDQVVVIVRGTDDAWDFMGGQRRMTMGPGGQSGEVMIVDGGGGQRLNPNGGSREGAPQGPRG